MPTAADHLTLPGAGGTRRAAVPLARLAAGAQWTARESRDLLQGVSVVICTRGRPDSVGRCLDGLRDSGDPPARLLVVDGSADCATEQHLARRRDLDALATGFEYVRVPPHWRGLTRQRNFALGRADTDVVAFFDDDVVLGPGCVSLMERTLRADPAIVGVGAVAPTDSAAPGRRLRARRMLGMVGRRGPGRYCRSGMSIGWRGLDRSRAVVEVDWLPGYAMAWRTAPAREVGFDERFAGYASGEDLDFGLRMARFGRLVVATRATLQHEHVAGGRPDPYRLGYTTVENAWAIQRRCLRTRTWLDAAWFTWAFGVDTLVQVAALTSPPGPDWRLAHARGRLACLARLLVGAAGARIR